MPVPRSLPSKKKSAAAKALKCAGVAAVFLTTQVMVKNWLPLTYEVVWVTSSPLLAAVR